MKSLQNISYKTLFTILFLSLAGIVFFIRIGGKTQKVSAAWWDEMWHYRKAISLTNSNTDITNQYVKITLDTASLISANKMKNTCDDIRVTNINGKLLTHFIDGNPTYTCNTNTTSIYVLFDSIPSSDATIYIYYGNPSATNVEPILGTQQNPGISCKNIFQHRNDNKGNKNYFITPSGNLADTLETECNMTDDSGGWTKVYDGLCTSATSTNRTTGNVLEISSPKLTFNQMRISANNWTYSDIKTTTETATMQLTFSGYYQWLHSQPDTPNPDVKFYSAQDGIQDVTFTSLGVMMRGYGNSWRTILPLFYTQPHDSFMYLGDLGGVGINRLEWGGTDYNTAMNNTYPTESGKGLTPKSFQEIKVWVRENEITLLTDQSIGSISTEELSPAPIAYWKFDEGVGTTAYDSTGANNGIISGATYTDESQCISGKCLYFDDAQNNYVLSSSTIPITGSQTYSVWVKPAATSPLVGILTTHNYADTSNIGINITGGKFAISIGYTDGTREYDLKKSNFTIPTNEWTHVGLIYNYTENSVSFYINGKFDNKWILNKTVKFLAKNILVGQWSNNFLGNYKYNGLIDEPKIYPYARTADQIKQDYNSRGSMSGAGVNLGVKSNTAPSLKSSLVAYWKFDEKNGTKVNNYVTNGIGLSGILGIANSTPTWSEGKINSGLNFLKSNINKNTVYINDDNSLDQLDDTSISTWFKSSNQPINNSSYKVLVIYQGASGHNLEDKYVSEGYNVTIDLGATTIATVASYQPDIVVCDRFAWGCSESFLNTLYNQGYNIASQGNDTTTTILPILSIVSAGGTASGTITPDEKHPIASGWSSTGNSGSDGRYGITSINSRAFSIAKDQTNNWTEVVYLEEPDKGRWVHYQTNASPDTTLFDNSNTFLLRSNLISKGKNYNLFLYKNNLYGWLNNQGINTSMTPNSWNHVNLNYNSSAISLYSNGIFKSSLSYNSSLDTDNNNLSFGNLLDGSLDEVKIYNRAITPEEVKQDYNAGSAIQFGQTTQNIDGTTTSLEYCIPGDTSFCDSPVAEWNFEENTGTVAKDISGNNNTGTINNTTWTVGKKNTGAGLNFSGSSQYITIEDSTSLKPTTNVTVETWFNTTNKTLNQRMVSKTNGGGYSLSVNENSACPANTLCFLININGSYYSASYPSSNLSNNTWYHAAGSYDGTTVRLFLNGSNIGTTASISNTITQNTAKLCIGSESAATNCYAENGFFSGKIDDVRIYNYARTPAQIAYDYNRGAPIGWWKLDECQGSTAFDSSGLGNTGVISIGQSGTQTTLGTCQTGTSAAWTNGASGKINSSLKLDGQDDYMTSPITVNGSNATIAFWVKNPTSGIGPYLLRSNAGVRTYITISGNTIGFMKGSPTAVGITGKTINPSEWNHVVLKWWTDNNGISYGQSYINGQALGTGSSFTDTTNGSYITLGGYTTTGTQNASGQFDDVRVYNYTLTSEQVKILYNGGSVNFQ